MQEGEVFEIAPQISTIRNSVIHAGKLADRKTADAYARLVFPLIQRIEDALDGYPDACMADGIDYLAKMRDGVPPGTPVTVRITLSGKVRYGSHQYTAVWLRHLNEDLSL